MTQNSHPDTAGLPGSDGDKARTDVRDHPQSWGEANQSSDDSWETTEDTNQPKEPLPED